MAERRLPERGPDGKFIKLHDSREDEVTSPSHHSGIYDLTTDEGGRVRPEQPFDADEKDPVEQD
jgi:hypothetical protein